MIKAKSKKPEGKIEIDLTGEQGNAFAVMGIASGIAKSLNRAGISKDFNKIQTEMMSGDYENLIEVMEREFGDFIIMYR